jgi:hypothetical protein
MPFGTSRSNHQMKTLLAVITALALAGCSTVEEQATRRCGVINDSELRDNCVAHYLSAAQAENNAEWEMVGASMLNRSH